MDAVKDIADQRSKAVDRGSSLPSLHIFGRDDHDLLTRFKNQLPQVIQQVVNPRACQIVQLDQTRIPVQPPGIYAGTFG